MALEMDRGGETVRPRVWIWRANPQRRASLWGPSTRDTCMQPLRVLMSEWKDIFTCLELKTKSILTFNTHTSVESTCKVCVSEIIPLRLGTMIQCEALVSCLRRRKASSTCLSLFKHTEKTRTAALREAWILSMHQVSAAQSISPSNAAPVAASISCIHQLTCKLSLFLTIYRYSLGADDFHFKSRLFYLDLYVVLGWRTERPVQNCCPVLD